MVVYFRFVLLFTLFSLLVLSAFLFLSLLHVASRVGHVKLAVVYELCWRRYELNRSISLLAAP